MCRSVSALFFLIDCLSFAKLHTYCEYLDGGQVTVREV